MLRFNRRGGYRRGAGRKTRLLPSGLTLAQRKATAKIVKRAIKGSKERHLELSEYEVDIPYTPYFQTFCQTYIDNTKFWNATPADVHIDIEQGTNNNQRIGDQCRLKSHWGALRCMLQQPMDSVPFDATLYVRVMMYALPADLNCYQVLNKIDVDTGSTVMTAPVKPEWRRMKIFDKVLRLTGGVQGLASYFRYRRTYRGLGRKLKFTETADNSPDNYHVNFYAIIERAESNTGDLYNVNSVLKICLTQNWEFYDD